MSLLLPVDPEPDAEPLSHEIKENNAVIRISAVIPILCTDFNEILLWFIVQI